ncbi:kelch-like protein 31 [Ptychodera flava]|uniref:kelch-like protein 31 n=1 Tax=Ptychodera flava TaxID=63121 RepID=UPI003969D89E
MAAASSSNSHQGLNPTNHSPRSMSSASPRSPRQRVYNHDYPPPNKTFTSESHPNDMLGSLNSLRIEKLLCDGTVIANGTHYMIHRAVLASCSDYFKTIFTTGNGIREVELPQVTTEGLEAILEYCYTSQITLMLENVESVLHAAIQLDMKTITNHCVEYLQTAICSDNAIHILFLADRLKFTSLLKVAQEYIIDNFVDVAQTQSYQLLKSDQVHGSCNRTG